MGDALISALLIGGIGMILAVFFAVFVLRDRASAVQAVVMAEVTELTMQDDFLRERSGGQMVNHPFPGVGLEVTTTQGRVRFGVRPEPYTFAKLKVEQAVAVRFDPRNPLNSVLDSAFHPGLRAGLRALGWTAFWP